MTLDELYHCTEAVLPVPVAGSVFGRASSQAYEMAKSGALPTVKVGARLYVPVPKLRELLGLPAMPTHDDAPAAGPGEGDTSSTQLPADEVDHVGS